MAMVSSISPSDMVVSEALSARGSELGSVITEILCLSPRTMSYYALGAVNAYQI